MLPQIHPEHKVELLGCNGCGKERKPIKPSAEGPQYRLTIAVRVDRLSGASVITSYSIHYTKLYDMSLGQVQEGLNIIDEALAFVEDSDERYWEAELRITSYNVCYTKLLRNIYFIVT